MLSVVHFLAGGLVGYIFGAIPFGFLFVKATRNVDLRTVGSGRTGGTNSFRAAGLWVGVLTSLGDVLKGAGAIWIARGLFGSILNTSELSWVVMFTAVMAVIGHNWSVFLGWAGGAGTGPNIGWAAAIWWPIAPIGGLVVLGVLIGLGMASVASLAMGALIPIVFAIRYFTGADPTAAYTIGGLLTLAVVAWALRPNIKRILNGTERLVGPRARLK